MQSQCADVATSNFRKKLTNRSEFVVQSLSINSNYSTARAKSELMLPSSEAINFNYFRKNYLKLNSVDHGVKGLVPEVEEIGVVPNKSCGSLRGGHLDALQQTHSVCCCGRVLCFLRKRFACSGAVVYCYYRSCRSYIVDGGTIRTHLAINRQLVQNC